MRFSLRAILKNSGGKSPRELPASIIRRLPIRYLYDDNYFNDCYQGIPKGGYTAFFEKILDGIELRLGVDYLANKESYNTLAKKVIYCGNIDSFFDYQFGELEWRSLRFENETMDLNDFQGLQLLIIRQRMCHIPVSLSINILSILVLFQTQERQLSLVNIPKIGTVVKRLTILFAIPMVTVNYMNVIKLKQRSWIIFFFRGRLAEYVYRDMCPTIGLALRFSEQELELY